MTRVDTLKLKYGEDYFKQLAYKVKQRKGFQDRPKYAAQHAQRQMVKAKLLKAMHTEPKDNSAVL